MCFEAVSPGIGLDALDGKLRCLGIKRRSVGESDTLAQVEAVVFTVLADRPIIGQKGFDLALLVDAHEAFVNIGHHCLRDGGAGGRGEVQ